MKEEGVTRFIGFSGHNDAVAMKTIAERGDFDTMLVAFNQWENAEHQRQEMAVPAAFSKGMGVMVMKALRPRDNDPSISPGELIRYGLSLDIAHGTVIGTDSLEVLDANIALLKNLKA